MPKIEVPEDYRGIPFNSWLDIFLDFALCLARHGKMKESYEMCQAAKDCALWYHCREDLFLIHLAWMSKSLFYILKTQLTGFQLAPSLFAMKKLASTCPDSS